AAHDVELSVDHRPSRRFDTRTGGHVRAAGPGVGGNVVDAQGVGYVGTANEAAGHVDLAAPRADSALAEGDGQRGDVAPSVGRVVIARDLVVQCWHGVGALAAGDVKQVVGA